MSLSDAIAAFVGAESWAGSQLVLEHHPELLTDSTVAMLTRLAADAKGPEAAAYRSHRDILRRCRIDGVDAVFTELVAPEVPTALRGRWAAAELAHERYRADQRPDTLNAAIALVTAVVDDPLVRRVCGPTRAGMARAAGVMLVERYLQANQPADLDAAVEMFQEAITDAGSTDRAEHLSDLGNALGMRYEEHGRLTDLDAGIAVLREAVTLETLDPASRRMLRHNLAANLGVRAEILGDPAALDEAIGYARAAVTEATDDEALSAFCNGLASVLLTRYERDGVLGDLRDAADAAERAFAEEPLPELQAVRGVVRQLQFDRTGDPALLDAAVEQLTYAAKGLAPGPHLSTCLGHLGNALLTRFELAGDRVDLDRAQQAVQRALTVVDPHSPRAAALRSSLGLVLLELHGCAGGALSDAVDVLEAAARDGTSAGQVRPYLLANLAYARQATAERDGTQDAVDAAAAAYRVACADALTGQVEIALTTARRWGTWAVRRRAWAEAAEAYETALNAAERLWRAQTGRADQEIWLGAAQGVPDRAGDAHARTGDFRQAVVVLELGRARLLAEALRGAPDQLDQHVPELAQRYRSIAARVRMAEVSTRHPGSWGLLR